MKKSTIFKISVSSCFLLSLLCCVIVLMCSQISYADNTLADEPSGEYTVVDVAYPNGVTLNANPENPENVVSYQWVSDNFNEEYNGTTAKTKDLVFPSTRKEYNNLSFSCKITYNDGHLVWKKVAQLNITNYSENLDVAYVSEYALAVDGSQIDLSEVGLGSGLVKRIDKQHFELFNVNFNNYQKIKTSSRVTFVSGLAINNNELINYWVKDGDISEVRVDIVGKNDVFNSPLYLEGEREGQPILDFYGQNDNIFDLNIVGADNSSFNAKGGNCFISSNADINIENLIFNAEALPKNRLDSGSGCIFMSNKAAPNINGITIKDSQLNFNVYGASIWSEKNIEVKNSTITSKNQYAFDVVRYNNYVIHSAWMFEASNSRFDIKVNELYSTEHFDGICAVSSKYRSVWDSCDLNFDLQAPVSKVSVDDVKGINCSSDTVKPYPGIEECLSISNSNLNIKIGDKNSKVISAHALRVNSDDPVTKIQNSIINCDVFAQHNPQGIFGFSDIDILNSQLNLNVDADDADNDAYCCAIVSRNGKVRIDLNNPQDKISVNVVAPNDKKVFGIGARLHYKDSQNYSSTEDFDDVVFINGAIQLPQNLCLDKYWIYSTATGRKVYCQTIFDKSDLEHPALNFTIGAVNPVNPQEAAQDDNANSSPATFDNTPALISALIIVLMLSVVCCGIAAKSRKHYL